MLPIWVVFAVLAAGGAMLIVRPILARPKDAAGTAAVETEATLNIYRDQLAEIERERERGLIGATEAEGARTEVARRLLGHAAARAELGDGGQADVARGPGRLSRNIALCVLFGVPIAAVLIYMQVGAPNLPSRPHAERAAVRPESAGIQELIARVEARLIERPDDGPGWDVIAPIYLRLGRYADAAGAFESAIRLNGESLVRLSGLAESAVAASPAGVPDTARQAFARILTLSPGRFDARFWLAVAKEQDGKRDAAKADYEAILKDAPADAPWRKLVNERLAAIGEAGSATTTPPPAVSPSEAKPVTAAPPSGPGQADIEAASRLSPDERQAMVRAMVDGLDKRLETNGGDAEGWRRLLQAYIVLGEKDKALAALARARKALSDDATGRASVEAAARQLNLTQ